MRQDVYRVALDEAQVELVDISKRFEDLRKRKDTLESVVSALGPMLGVADAKRPDAHQESAAPAPVSIEKAAPEPQASTEPYAYTFEQAAAPLPDEEITDPFQRRVRNALKFSNGNNGHDRRGLQPAV